MTAKDRHYKPTVGVLIVIDKNKNERTRQRPFDSNGRDRSGRPTSRNLRRLHPQKVGGNMNMNIKTQWRGHQNTPQRNHPWQDHNGKIMIGREDVKSTTRSTSK